MAAYRAVRGGGVPRAASEPTFPNVDLPTLLVTASLPGASPETMAAAVATPASRTSSPPLPG